MSRDEDANSLEGWFVVVPGMWHIVVLDAEVCVVCCNPRASSSRREPAPVAVKAVRFEPLGRGSRWSSAEAVQAGKPES